MDVRCWIFFYCVCNSLFLFLWLVNIIFLLFVFWVRRVEGDNIRGFLGFVDIGIRGFELIMEEVFVKNVVRILWVKFLDL